MASRKRCQSAELPIMPTKNGGRSARATNGHVMAEQATTLMKSRRRIASPKGTGLRHLERCNYSRDLRPAKWGLTINLHYRSLELPMSAFGSKADIVDS